MNTRVVIIGLLILLILGGAYLLIARNRSSLGNAASTPRSLATSSLERSALLTSPPSSTASPEAPPPNPMPSGQTPYYPITHYADRITNRWYGKAIVANDNQSIPCGAPFSGLHVGDDLEVANNELTSDVPVYSIADGTVRQASTVNGYGGLIVVQYNLNGQTVTGYYGHVNLARANVKSGDSVKAGQQLTVLGNACSAQTGGERKHLHFALHKGIAIDVRGYAPTPAALSLWLNPKEILTNLHAQEPAT